MRRGFDRNTKRQTTHWFLCAAIFCVASSITQAATVEWHLLMGF
jgi:hypothetical protein